jgi:hypothetical protein
VEWGFFTYWMSGGRRRIALFIADSGRRQMWRSAVSPAPFSSSWGRCARNRTSFCGVDASLRRCGAVRGRCELVAGQRAALEDDGWRGGWVVVMGLVSGDSSTNFRTL